MPEVFQAHPDLLFQLVAMMSPNALIKNGIPVCRAQQMPGQFIVTLPAAYHAGFSQGVNCCEAVNFATADWLPWGFDAIQRYRLYRRLPVFSHEELVLQCAKPEIRAQLPPEMFSFVLGEVQRIRNLEKHLRSRLRDAQKAGMLVVRCETKTGKKTIDTLRDRNCVICNHVLFMSGVTCECSPGKLVCLNHVDHLCACPQSRRCLHIRATLNEIEAIFEDAQDYARFLSDPSPTHKIQSIPASPPSSPAVPSPKRTKKIESVSSPLSQALDGPNVEEDAEPIMGVQFEQLTEDQMSELRHKPRKNKHRIEL
eukprot:c1621_g1_i1.p1 GENE.c1621_g1_i1~~c1621_g1_i1.p1  ORF type:complete len:344 (-),score=57.45 c1621_g1_i1:17-949(-)